MAADRPSGCSAPGIERSGSRQTLQPATESPGRCTSPAGTACCRAFEPSNHSVRDSVLSASNGYMGMRRLLSVPGLIVLGLTASLPAAGQAQTDQQNITWKM